MQHVSEAVRYSRLLRPYSLKRLDRALWHVEATYGAIRNRRTDLLVNPPVDPADWAFELEQLQTDLEVLSEYCEDAHKRLGLLVSSAPHDYEVAIDAMTRMLQGISAVSKGEA